MIHHLGPNGSMALLLANGSMSSKTNNEGEIRKALIDADLVECMVALPGQLFTNTQIPACIWFLTRSKAARNGWRDRKGETLFIDARNLGYMKDRVLRDFKIEDIHKMADTFHAWRERRGLRGRGWLLQGCQARRHQETRQRTYPGRYVGAAEQEDDGEIFEDKMARLTSQLNDAVRRECAIGSCRFGRILRGWVMAGEWTSATIDQLKAPSANAIAMGPFGHGSRPRISLTSEYQSSVETIW